MHNMDRMFENGDFKKGISLRPRLSAVASLLPSSEVVADIGCDHGRLGIGLLQKGIANRVILSELSKNSLRKAQRLANITGLNERISFRVGDGLSVLEPYEALSIAICGMGGMLIRDILSAASIPLMGAKTAALLPMRGVDELRAYLFYNGYRITKDRIARENGRLYQLFSIERGNDEMPPYWPRDCFSMGFHAIDDPLFNELAIKLLSQAEQNLSEAKGSRAEPELKKRVDDMMSVLNIK